MLIFTLQLFERKLALWKNIITSSREIHSVSPEHASLARRVENTEGIFKTLFIHNFAS